MRRQWVSGPASPAGADAAVDGGEHSRRARDIYLAWLLHLPADVDPSMAAATATAKVLRTIDVLPVCVSAYCVKV